MRRTPATTQPVACGGLSLVAKLATVLSWLPFKYILSWLLWFKRYPFYLSIGTFIFSSQKNEAKNASPAKLTPFKQYRGGPPACSSCFSKYRFIFSIRKALLGLNFWHSSLKLKLLSVDWCWIGSYCSKFIPRWLLSLASYSTCSFLKARSAGCFSKSYFAVFFVGVLAYFSFAMRFCWPWRAASFPLNGCNSIFYVVDYFGNYLLWINHLRWSYSLLEDEVVRPFWLNADVKNLIVANSGYSVGPTQEGCRCS